jgi:hypothetical protein
LRDIGRAYPAEHYPQVVLVIDNASWHRGGPITKATQPATAAAAVPVAGL